MRTYKRLYIISVKDFKICSKTLIFKLDVIITSGGKHMHKL